MVGTREGGLPLTMREVRNSIPSICGIERSSKMISKRLIAFFTSCNASKPLLAWHMELYPNRASIRCRSRRFTAESSTVKGKHRLSLYVQNTLPIYYYIPPIITIPIMMFISVEIMGGMKSTGGFLVLELQQVTGIVTCRYFIHSIITTH